MSFKLTYSTMFSPPPQLHTRFDEAMREALAALGQQHKIHLAGSDRSGAHTLATRSPIDQRTVLGEFAVATANEAEQALQAAQRAWKGWQRTPPARRADHLRRVAQLIEQRVFDIAAVLTLEVGKNRMEALGEVQETADFFNGYADEFEQRQGFDNVLPNDPLTGFISRNRSVLKPYGPWVVINPFNFPFALAGGPVAAALITGNTVVLKGAPGTPWAGRLLADCIRDAGFPAGVFNYLSGADSHIGPLLTQHPLTAGVTFTGSHEVGVQIGRALWNASQPKPYIAEMGGKNACIVTASADLERAATGIIRSAFGMGGQKCSALSRLYVAEKVADSLLQRLLEQTSRLRIGNPAKQEIWLGPTATVSGYESYARYSAQLSSQGARTLRGGAQVREGELAHGLFVEPLIAEAPPEHPLWDKEMFQPILMVQRVESNEAAMALANRSPLGLTAGFYGAPDEIAWFHENIEAGVTYVNRPQGATTGAWPGYQPFAGWKGSGNTGKAIASFYYLPQYMREQSQTVVE